MCRIVLCLRLALRRPIALLCFLPFPFSAGLPPQSAASAATDTRNRSLAQLEALSGEYTDPPIPIRR